MEQNQSYRVLSLDGGGMRGLYTAVVLQTLSNRFSGSNCDRDIGKGFDLIVGTSTGGILACALAKGVPVRQIIDLYSQKGKKIFENPVPFEGKLKQYWWIFKNRKKPANSNKVLRQELQNIFNNKTLRQLYQERAIGLCITAVDLIDHSPRVFKTPHDARKTADNNRTLVDICIASSSAPIIFPIARIPDPERSNIYEDFVDGGLWANSPTLVALTEAVTCSKKDQNIEIISVGTCAPPKGQTVKNLNRGLLDWRAGIGPMEISMDSQIESGRLISAFLCAEFNRLGRNITIQRLKQTAPSLEQTKLFAMDQADEQTCSMLIKWGKKDAEETYGKIISKGSKDILKSIFTNLPTLERRK